jgi:hypothetical protein
MLISPGNEFRMMIDGPPTSFLEAVRHGPTRRFDFETVAQRNGRSEMELVSCVTVGLGVTQLTLPNPHQ